MAPYSHRFNFAPTPIAASNGTSRDGCVRERTGESAYKDTSIRDGGAYRGNGRFNDIDRTEGLQSYVCPSAEIVPLTDDKTVLTNSIKSYRASGATAGHIGAQWAWNLVSPNFAPLWPTDSDPVDYDDGKTIKAVILMTDGVFKHGLRQWQLQRTGSFHLLKSRSRWRRCARRSHSKRLQYRLPKRCWKSVAARAGRANSTKRRTAMNSKRRFSRLASR